MAKPRSKPAFDLGDVSISSQRKVRKVARVLVQNPYGNGMDEVNKKFDQLGLMHKRRQINDRQFQAGERLQIAFDTVYGSPGGAMNFDRTRGGSMPGAPPLPSYLLAAEYLHQAKFRLYPRDYAVVYRVCIEGQLVSHCVSLFGEGRQAKEAAGKAFRIGLSDLAEMWWPEGKRQHQIESFRVENSVVTETEIVQLGKVYHAG